MQSDKNTETIYNVLSETCRHELTNLLDKNKGVNHIDIKDDIEWASLLRLARIHGVRPILLLGSQKLRMPSDVEQQLSSQCRSIVFKNFSIYREGLIITDYLHEHNIPYEHHKGVHLAQRLFGNIGMREMSDIDILLYPKDLEAIGSFLISRGYRAETKIPKRWMRWHMYNNCEYNFDYYLNGQRIFHVEPHWFLGARVMQMNIGLSDLYQYRNHAHENLSPELLLIWYVPITVVICAD